MIVSNTSPLLYLAKLGKLDLLKKLFNKVFIPEAVYDEAVLNGKDFIDSKYIQVAIDSKWIEVKKVSKKSEIYNEIDIGESEAIELAKELKSKILLIDDAPARVIAESFNLNVKGTLYVLLKSCNKKIISKNELKSLLIQLIELGFRISTDLYGKILNEIDKF